jgi:heme-degrading monooxygenase HmoA
MIARTWHGATSARDANEYVQYLLETGLAEFRQTEGNRGALALRRIEGDRAEFVVLSLWESEAAVRRFAGDKIEQAVFYPEDERFLVDRDSTVTHYEVVFDSAAVPQT